MRVIALAGLVILLSGCSYSYDVIAKVIDGRLAFASKDDDYTCIANIFVTAEDGVRAVPAPSDQRGLVLNGGAFWWTDAPVARCTTKLPVFYGSVAPSVGHYVSPKPLRIGVMYAVNTEGGGAYGHGCFRITPTRRIQNLPYDECIRTEQGEPDKST